MPRYSQLVAAAELADNYIEIILSEEPALLVERIADQGSKDIAKSAKALAEFRHQLIKALAGQPLSGLVVEDGNFPDDPEDVGRNDPSST